MILGLTFYQNGRCQTLPVEYKMNISMAESLYHKGDYLNAAKTFSKAFESFNGIQYFLKK